MLASFKDTRELRRRSQEVNLVSVPRLAITHGKNDIPIGAKAKFAFCVRLA